MTVSQESNGTKVARPWTSPSRAARRALCPRQSSTSPATPRGANGHMSYGGSARATRAPLTAAPANRGPSPAGRQREGAAARSAASGPACPVAVLVTVGAGPSRASSSGTALTRGRAATVQRPGAGGGAGGSGRDRRPTGGALALETGQGPDRPSDRPRPAGCRIEGRCLLGGRALPVSHPRGTPPHPGATTAIGPGTWTALAHCAVPGPKPARVCRGGGFLVGVLWWTSLTLVAPTGPCQPPRDLRRCAKPQVAAARRDQTFSLCW